MADYTSVKSQNFGFLAKQQSALKANSKLWNANTISMHFFSLANSRLSPFFISKKMFMALKSWI